MLTLINTNRMTPPIGPLGLDYIAGAACKAGIKTDLVDLCLADDPLKTLQDYFAGYSPQLVGLSFRNVDDCFWPSARWFIPDLAETIRTTRTMTDAPIVLGGVGFSIFARQIVEYTGADFGIRGDGENATVLLHNQLCGSGKFEKINGLIWRSDGALHSNRPCWPEQLSLPTGRDAIDNPAYFKKGGQGGIETKRGCNRRCIYCADPLTKGTALRLREPAEVANEAESLLAQEIDVLHLCDSEFNIPRSHAYAVCEEFNRRGLGKRLRWFTYMAVTPFDAELASAMSKAGCVGIDFTGDSSSPSMLKTYRQAHLKEDLASAVRLCRDNNIKVMIDLLLGGPGETPETVAETIDFIKQINPDCAGAPLGARIYPDTEMAHIVENEGPLETNPNIRRKYTGTVDFFQPTFYISQALGPKPAELVRDLIDGDKRFFEPMPDIPEEGQASTDHNYNDNTELVEAIKNGARGAYWDILRQLRGSTSSPP
jgi:radical SAM superfamily enzyme YgiQ (UPF0313 family)